MEDHSETFLQTAVMFGKMFPCDNAKLMIRLAQIHESEVMLETMLRCANIKVPMHFKKSSHHYVL